MSYRAPARSSAALFWLLLSPLMVAGCGGVTDSTVDRGTQVDPGIIDLRVQPSSLELTVGSIAQLTASARDARGPISPFFRWSSSNPAVAVVFSTGSVRAIAAGATAITLSAGTKSVVALVTVK